MGLAKMIEGEDVAHRDLLPYVSSHSKTDMAAWIGLHELVIQHASPYRAVSEVASVIVFGFCGGALVITSLLLNLDQFLTKMNVHHNANDVNKHFPLMAMATWCLAYVSLLMIGITQRCEEVNAARKDCANKIRRFACPSLLEKEFQKARPQFHDGEGFATEIDRSLVLQSCMQQTGDAMLHGEKLMGAQITYKKLSLLKGVLASLTVATAHSMWHALQNIVLHSGDGRTDI